MVIIEPFNGVEISLTPAASPSSCSSGGGPPLPTTFPYPDSVLFFPDPFSWPMNFFPHQTPFPFGYGYDFGYGLPGFLDSVWFQYDLNNHPQPWVQTHKTGSDRVEKPARVSGLEKGTTTLMIRNLPTKLRREELMNLLDEHCREINKSAPRNSHKHQSAYDFLYLPFDFKERGNLGYAFVNFTTARAAFRFFGSWNGRGWRDFYKCRKICAITRAEIQGKDASRKHLEACKFFCHTRDYLPVEFSPPRNGYNVANIRMETFGIWVCRDEKKHFKIWKKKRVSEG